MVTHDVVVVVVRLNQPQLCVNTIISRLRCVEGGICASQEHLHHCREMTGYLTGGSPMSRSTTSSTASVSVGLHTYKHRRSPAVNKRWENHMCWFVNLLTHKAVDMKIRKIARRVEKKIYYCTPERQNHSNQSISTYHDRNHSSFFMAVKDYSLLHLCFQSHSHTHTHSLPKTI